MPDSLPSERSPIQPLAAAQLLVLLALVAALVLPLLRVAVPLWVVAALLGVRLLLRVGQGLQNRLYFRPAAWVLDAALLGLLLWQGHQP